MWSSRPYVKIPLIKNSAYFYRLQELSLGSMGHRQYYMIKSWVPCAESASEADFNVSSLHASKRRLLCKSAGPALGFMPDDGSGQVGHGWKVVHGGQVLSWRTTVRGRWVTVGQPSGSCQTTTLAGRLVIVSQS